MYDQHECLCQLNNQDTKKVIQSAKQIGEHGTVDCVMELIKLIATRRDKWVRVNAIEALCKISERSGDRRILIYSLQFLDHPRNEELLPWLIKYIGSFGKGGKYRDKIRDFLKHEDARVRADTAEALDELGEDNMIDLLMPMLNDENHRVKSTVAKILWKYGGGRMVGILKDMLANENIWDRAAAAFALGEIGGFQVIDLLKIALKDEAPEVLRNAVKAFGKVGEKSTAPLLMPFLNHNDYDVKKNTVEALGLLEYEAAMKPLCDLGMEKHSEDMVNILNKALTKICEAHTAKAVGFMVMLLKNPNDSMRAFAARLLGIIGTRDVLHFLEKILKEDSSEGVRAVAAEAIEAINCK